MDQLIDNNAFGYDKGLLEVVKAFKKTVGRKVL